MRKWIISGALFFFTLPAIAGDEVGGGGIAENNVLYAWHNLSFFIDVNLSNTPLSEKEMILLGRIRDSLPKEKEFKDPIRFRAESAQPGFFFVDGQLRIARTGYKVGEPIYFNLDLMYPMAGAASIPLLPPPDRPLDIPLAVGILVHELGHHQGEKDHTALDVLGAKVNSAMRVYAHEVDGGPYRRDLIATSFEPSDNFPGDLIIRDGGNLHSFREQILKVLSCPRAPATHFTFWNLHWLKERPISEDAYILPLQARVILGCGTEGSLVKKDVQTLLWMSRDKTGVWKVRPEQTKFSVKP